MCTKFNLFCLKPPVKISDFTTEYVKCISFLIYKGEITLGKIITCIKRLNVNYIYFVLNHETLCTYIYMHTSILRNIYIKYTGNCFSLLHSSSFLVYVYVWPSRVWNWTSWRVNYHSLTKNRQCIIMGQDYSSWIKVHFNIT